MDDTSGGGAEDPPVQKVRHCLHCNKIFEFRQKNHRCCSAECNAKKAKLNKTDPTAARKRSLVSSPNSDISSNPKKGKPDLELFLHENSIQSINELSRDDLVSHLCTAVTFLHDQWNFVTPHVFETLEDSVENLTASLAAKYIRIAQLKAEIISIKVSFADTVLSLKSTESSRSPSLLFGPTYASVTRDKLDLLEVEKLLDTSNNGLIPSHVRFKNSKMFVTLENDVAVAKAADILNKKPEYHSRFNPASKPYVLYPFVALFVNVSDLYSLKKELEHRNSLLRVQIHSLRTIFTKPNTTEGHVKLFIRSKLTSTVKSGGALSVKSTDTSNSPVHPILTLAANVRGSTARPKPFAYSATTPVVANIPPGFSSFHQLSTDHAYGSAILVRDHIVKSGKLSTCHLSNSSACVALNTNNGTLRLASVYLRPSLSLPDFSSLVSTILSSVTSPHSLICVDSNAKSPVWNSASTNQRGSELERLLAEFKMSVANQPLNSLDFVPGGTAFVDITLTGDRVHLSRWLFFISSLTLRSPLPKLRRDNSNFYSQASPRFTTSGSFSAANRQRTF
uniref:Endonuclease/exonuclease/phosphatase domain-containing protein n=1 Tax=Daphnia galeata TaxID=27404 RepID=A0A8J2RQL0_9CRUS|nr:unnamed protein product [Daphnia galeata]